MMGSPMSPPDSRLVETCVKLEIEPRRAEVATGRRGSSHRHTPQAAENECVRHDQNKDLGAVEVAYVHRFHVVADQD